MPSQLCVQSTCARALASHRKPRWQPASVTCLKRSCVWILAASAGLLCDSHMRQVSIGVLPYKTPTCKYLKTSTSEHLQISAGRNAQTPV